MSDENLWGDLNFDTTLETPASILRAQGAALNQLTKGLLEGRVVSLPPMSDQIVMEFRIIAPALRNYSVTILRITHDATLYPATVTPLDGTDREIKAPSAKGLKTILAHIFRSEYVRNVLNSLIVQVREAGSGVSH